MTKRPNILFVLSDDQGPWAMGCAGNNEIETPYLDRLAASGMRFDHFFCTSPVCSPARASLLTGRIPSQHGVHDWLASGNTNSRHEGHGDLIEYLEGQTGYTELLAEAGYHCGLSGKWHLGDAQHPQKGFEFWEVHAKGGGPYYQAPMVHDGEVYEEPRYVTDAITDTALRWLDERDGDPRPFYLGVHYTAPHSPWGRDEHPHEIYDHYFEHCDFQSVPANEEVPDWVEEVSIDVRSEEKRREVLSGYFAAVTAMDRNIGRLIDWIESKGLREDTLIIFTSDNGMNMGHHGLYGKGNASYPLNMFDESVKVPFIASQPEHVPSSAICSELVSQYDFMPTVLDYIGLASPAAAALPGTSFASALRGDTHRSEAPVVVFDEYGPVRMIRDRRWKYVHRFGDGPHELYDLEADSAERQNLAGRGEHADIEAGMRDRLLEWFDRYVDPRCDGSRYPVTGRGQLGRCEEAEGQGSVFAPRH